MNIEVSIIMPAYNAEKYIDVAIKSVLEQTYDEWILYVIDDGSADNTVGVIEKFSSIEGRIRLIQLNENKGIANARNIALEQINSKFIAFLDSDDYWHPEKLEKQLSFMINNNYYFTFTDYYLINEEGKQVGEVQGNNVTVLDYKELLKTNRIGCLTVILNREKLNNIQFNKIRHEDYNLWLDLLKTNNVCAFRFPEKLSYYRKSSTSVSGNKIKSVLWVWTIIRKGQKFSFTESLWIFSKYIYYTFRK